MAFIRFRLLFLSKGALHREKKAFLQKKVHIYHSRIQQTKYYITKEKSQRYRKRKGRAQIQMTTILKKNIQLHLNLALEYEEGPIGPMTTRTAKDLERQQDTEILVTIRRAFHITKFPILKYVFIQKNFFPLRWISVYTVGQRNTFAVWIWL